MPVCDKRIDPVFRVVQMLFQRHVFVRDVGMVGLVGVWVVFEINGAGFDAAVGVEIAGREGGSEVVGGVEGSGDREEGERRGDGGVDGGGEKDCGVTGRGAVGEG